MMLQLYNHKAIKWLLLLTLLTVTTKTLAAQTADKTIQRSAPPGSYGGLLNPDLSVIVDLQYALGEKEDPEKDKVRLTAIEVVYGGFLYPGIRGDVIFCIDQDYSRENEPATEFAIEEAYTSFLELPLGLQLIAGRKLVDFGRVNQFHPHYNPFADTPLVSEHIFGGLWVDDGLNLSFLVPNPLDIYLKTSVSALNGSRLNATPSGLQWAGRVFNSRISMDLPWIHSIVGYSRAWDESADTSVENIEVTFRYHWPGFARRHLRLQNEYFWAERDGEKIDPGFYSLAVFSFDQYLEIGVRYDALLSAEDNTTNAWSSSFFATWYWTHSMYLRGQYKYNEEESGEKENMFIVQLNWGMGPHAHRLED